MAQIVTGQEQTRSDKPETFDETAHTGTGNVAVADIKEPGAKTSGHSLVIRVTEGGKSKANIHIPIGIARVAGKFIPPKEKENLKAQGIDIDEILGELTGDELGELVQVDEEGKSVWIGVE